MQRSSGADVRARRITISEWRPQFAQARTAAGWGRWPALPAPLWWTLGPRGRWRGCF